VPITKSIWRAINRFEALQSGDAERRRRGDDEPVLHQE